jgi:tetratricopeptide (TPR) repeat protein
MYLAMGYRQYQNFRESARLFEAAAQKACDDEERMQLLREAAETQVYSGEFEAATEIIDRMKALVETSGIGGTDLLNALRIFVEAEGDSDAHIAVMERIFEIDPSDTRTRFAVAFKYSQLGNNELALFHYLRIPLNERHRTTWNNLGVAFDQSELPVKSVDAYRRAEEMGETLAMSNLAEKLIKSGFLLEAQGKCDAALKIENFHENIGRTLARLKSQREQEEQKEKNILEKMKTVSDFYMEFGRALTKMFPKDLPKRWRAPECMVDATLRFSEFNAVGAYEQTSLGAFGFASLGVLNAKSAPDQHKIEFKGRLRGRAIEGSVYRLREGEPPGVPSLMSGGLREHEFKVIMMLSDDDGEIHVMENPRGPSPKIYTLKRELSHSDN